MSNTVTAAENPPVAMLSPGESFLNAIGDGIVEAVLAINFTSKQIVYWNHGAAELFGYAPGEVLERSIEMLFPDGNACEAVFDVARDAVHRHGYWSGKTVLGRKDPSTFAAEVTFATYMQLGSDNTYAVVVVRDVTDEDQKARELRQKTVFVSLLNRIAAKANLSTGTREAMEFAAEAICRALDWPLAHVYCAAAGSPAAIAPTSVWYEAEDGAFDEFKRTTMQLFLREWQGLPGRVFTSKKPAWVSDVAHQPDFLRGPVAKKAGIVSAFAFPIVVGSEVSCIMEFFSTRAEEPDSALLDVMASIGMQLGRVVERVYAEQTIEETNRRLAFLHRIAEVANSAASIDEMLQQSVALTCAYTGWCVGHVLLADGFGKLSHTEIWHPQDQQEYREFCGGNDGDLNDDELAMRVLRDRQPHWLADIDAGSPSARLRRAAASGMRRVVAFPIMAGNDVVAVQEFYSTDASDPEGAVLDTMASVGIQLGRVFERQKSIERLRRVEAVSAIGTLATQIAHEIASPLNGMYSTVQILDRLVKRGKVDMQEIGEMTGNIAGEINRLRSLLDELRQLVRPRELKLEPVDLAAVLLEICQLEKSVCESQGIEVTADCVPLRVQGDRDKLKQALLNIYRNAVEAMPDGGRLQVRSFEDGNHAVVQLQDTGPGIGAGNTIYDLFASSKSAGTGLGLPISQQIITTHNGRIEHANMPEGGARFSVLLPLHR